MYIQSKIIGSGRIPEQHALLFNKRNEKILVRVYPIYELITTNESAVRSVLKNKIYEIMIGTTINFIDRHSSSITPYGFLKKNGFAINFFVKGPLAPKTRPEIIGHNVYMLENDLDFKDIYVYECFEDIYNDLAALDKADDHRWKGIFLYTLYEVASFYERSFPGSAANKIAIRLHAQRYGFIRNIFQRHGFQLAPGEPPPVFKDDEALMYLKAGKAKKYREWYQHFIDEKLHISTMINHNDIGAEGGI